MKRPNHRKNKRKIRTQIELIQDFRFEAKKLTTIKSAAIKHKGKVFEGREHCQILSLYGLPTTDIIYGFVTTKNEFVDRTEAYKIAVNSGQIQGREHDHQLYSYDLKGLPT